MTGDVDHVYPAECTVCPSQRAVDDARGLAAGPKQGNGAHEWRRHVREVGAAVGTLDLAMAQVIRQRVVVLARVAHPNPINHAEQAIANRSPNPRQRYVSMAGGFQAAIGWAVGIE